MKQQPSAPQGRSPQGGRRISLAAAAERTALFRNEYVLKKPDREERIKANLFSRESIEEILRQPGCCGIRIYHAVNPAASDPLTGAGDRIRELILVGTDKEGNDMLTTADYTAPGKNNKGCNLLSAVISLPASPQQVQDAVLMAEPLPCPNMCGKPNKLNTPDTEQ